MLFFMVMDTLITEIIISSFADALNYKKSSISSISNFFEIGGESLQATKAISRINYYLAQYTIGNGSHYKNSLSITDFFDHPNPAQLSQLLINKIKDA